MSRSSPSAINVSRNTCKLCNVSLSRGGGTSKAKSSFNTTNLRKHLESVHSAQWTEVHDDEKRKSTSSFGQATLNPPSTSAAQSTITNVFNNKHPWDFDDERSRRVHRAIAEMIATDDQPVSVVNNSGFRGVVKVLEPRIRCQVTHTFT